MIKMAQVIDEIEQMALNGDINGDGEAMLKRVAEACRKMGGTPSIQSKANEDYPYTNIRCDMDETMKIREIHALDGGIHIMGDGRDVTIANTPATATNISNSASKHTHLDVFTLTTDPGGRHPAEDVVEGLENDSRVLGDIPVDTFEAEVHKHGQRVEMILHGKQG